MAGEEVPLFEFSAVVRVLFHVKMVEGGVAVLLVSALDKTIGINALCRTLTDGSQQVHWLCPYQRAHVWVTTVLTRSARRSSSRPVA